MVLLLLLFLSIDIAGIQQLLARSNWFLRLLDRLLVSGKMPMSPIVLNVKDENRQVKEKNSRLAFK
jgi:hypothetical protein